MANRNPAYYSITMSGLQFSMILLVIGAFEMETGDKEHNCITAPADCKSPSCQMKLCHKQISDSVEFNVSYQFDSVTSPASENKYIAVGLSMTRMMADTSVMYCKFPIEGPPGVGLAYTVGHQLVQLEDQKLIDDNIKLMFAETYNGTNECSFTRKIIPTSLPDKILPLNDSYYLLIAVGNLDAAGTTLDIHETDPTMDHFPFVTKNKINLFDPIESPQVPKTGRQAQPTAAEYLKKLLKKCHGALMIIGWWFFVANALLSARFLKQYKTERNFCGVKLWFLLHRTLNVMGFIICLSAFVLILVAAQGNWTGTTFPTGTHAILGMTASVGIFLQPILAYFRPAPTDGRRIVFNWLHGTIGYGSLCCASAAIYLITYSPFKFNFNGKEKYGVAPTALIILLIICFILIAVCLEANRITWRMMLNRKSVQSTRHLIKFESLPIKVIGVYVFVSAIVCAALITFLFV